MKKQQEHEWVAGKVVSEKGGKTTFESEVAGSFELSTAEVKKLERCDASTLVNK